MRVLFLPDYSAANAYQRELAAALRRHGVVVSGDPTQRRRWLPILSAVRRHGWPEVVHLHWLEPYLSGGGQGVSILRVARTLAELVVLRAMGTRIVWTAHELVRHDHTVDRRERLFQRCLARLASRVIVHCQVARSSLVEALGTPGGAAAGRVMVVAHGHYLDAYPNILDRGAARTLLGVPQGAFVVGFAGWIRPYKGIDRLLDAFRGIDRSDIRLVIAGRADDAAFAAELEALAAQDSRVVLRTGFIPDAELQVVLNASDVIALPYREVLTSGSALLAMSFGRAVLAPRVGCLPEVLDPEGAILYDLDDPSALRSALLQAMTADLWRMGEHNRQVCIQHHGWDRIARATLGAYRG